MSGKFKEFWIRDNAESYGVNRPNYFCAEHSEIENWKYHVIEYAAYEQLKQDLEACIEALISIESRIISGHPLTDHAVFIMISEALSKLKYKKEM